ncbi:DUF3189 family protein [Ammoniphilus sp. YIM 78166]|uniref:DUF3189 family protein n=1 Tax=Ammoniphilus sp. YIM 78166 TaxID=1644106 RepID=UPI00107050C6|nr:DUF3189 family protein [Ammoniphilus sp. YIM 78166]
MIFIYNDFGGTHSTVLAASYHLKKLDETREPTKEEILSAHHFNKLRYKDRGKFYFHGVDEEGNSVYTIGRGRSKILIPGIENFIRTLHEEQLLHEKIILSNTSPTVPLPMTFGGMFSRWLRVDFIGVPLLVMGAKHAYKDIITLVHHTKMIAKSSTSQLVVLDNKQPK